MIGNKPLKRSALRLEAELHSKLQLTRIERASRLTEVGTRVVVVRSTPAEASRKFVWLKTLKPLASNFMFTRSVNLKVFDNVISASQ